MTNKTIANYGKSIGLENLELSEKNVLQLTFEEFGDLYIEEVPPQLLICFMRKIENPSLETFKNALRITHFKEKLTFPVDIGLHKDDIFTFTIRLQFEDIRAVNITKAVEFLIKLHNKLEKLNNK